MVADYDGSDTLVATYNTPGLDNNLTKKVGENVYFFTKDGLGSIRNIHDSSEVLKNSYDYKAFGEVQGMPTENVTNRYRYTAREWESVPALHFYRARMYDQTLGLFLSRDPMRFNWMSLYKYCSSNPTNFADPLGLIEEDKCNCTVYLTFDDGPRPGTDDVLDELKAAWPDPQKLYQFELESIR